MAKKQARTIVVLKNPDTGSLYYTKKSAHNTPDKLEMKKYDPKIRKVATFVESKVKLGG
ncbi:MAG: 50S ribosomal protein L33 [Candidatus Saccharibacteria bacterium]|jgi:large subunit ribosomal protein L33